jgi:hypothetical protein
MTRRLWSTVPLAAGLLVTACGAPAPSAPPKASYVRKAVAPAPEITGLGVLMVAESLVPLAASKFLGIAFEDEPISSHGLDGGVRRGGRVPATAPAAAD